MSWWMWVAIILTSPFWMVALIVIGSYICTIILGVMAMIAAIIDEILILFRKKR